MYNHTPADGYILQIVGTIHPNDRSHRSPSHRVVSALQGLNPRIQTKGFRSAVLDAIFEHAVVEHFDDVDDEAYGRRLLDRLKRRYGAKRTRELLVDRCDVLNTWRHRDARFRPDAFLVDAPNWTVVCYEIEDTHPLNSRSILEYAAAWWCLDYIYWDLHLISYDIYGHHRVHDLAIAGVLSQHILKRRNAA
jgi:hypothetical protein